jgi:hypothetical protein
LQLDKFHFTLTSFLRYQQARPADPTNTIYTRLSAFISREICGLGRYYLCFGKEPLLSQGQACPRAGGLIALEFPQSGKVFTAECAEDAEIFNFVFFSTVSACSAVNPAIRLAGGNV